MSQAHAEAEDLKPHVLPVKIYFAVWAGLLALTAVTVWVSYFDFGTANLIVAMGVATFKASLVALFFMHLKYDEKFNGIVFVSSLVFLGIFFVLTLADTMERGSVDPIEADEIELVPARPELLELKNHGAGEHGAAGEHADPAAADHTTPAATGDEQADPSATGNEHADPPATDDGHGTPDAGGGH